MAENKLKYARSVAIEIVGRYAALPEVEAVALGGSLSSGLADLDSDIDLYVYSCTPLALDDRQAAAMHKSDLAEVGNAFWEPGDEWIDVDSFIHVDVMFRTQDWIEQALDRVLVQYTACVGYTTCLWYNVLHSQALFDRQGWFSRLQERARAPYPEKLRQAIVAKNFPLLKDNLSAYLRQLERSLAREDLIGANHRVAALLASYFDILFAVNRLPNPGEKRVLKIVERDCQRIPPHLRQHTEALVRGLGKPGGQALEAAEALIEGLAGILVQERLIPRPGETAGGTFLAH